MKRTGLFAGGFFLSSLTALAGVIVLLTGGSPGSVRLSDMTGDALAFAAACCWALFSVLSARIRLPIAESESVLYGDRNAAVGFGWFCDSHHLGL